MNFLKKNFILILIFLLAFFLRFNYDLLIKGYNFDEIAIVSVAKQAFPFDLIKTIATIDYHAPLYYFIAHPFTNLENEWLYLRFLNLIFSLINIFVFYKIGTLIKGKNFGLILALFLSVSHIQITTVSLIKFYCLCFLLFSIVIYYLLKVIKNDCGYKKLAVANFFFILSSTFGFIVVFCEYLILYLLKRNKNILKSALFAFLGFLLYLPIFLQQIILNSTTPISPHATYCEFSFMSLYNFINDYFSPLLNYCCNLTPIASYTYLLNLIQSIKIPPFDYLSFFVFVFLSFIPVVFAIFGIAIAIKKNSYFRTINLINIAYLCIFSFLVIIEKTGFVPIYIYPSGLILIVSALYGISKLKNKFIKTFLLGYMISAQLLISNVYPPHKREFGQIKAYYCFDKYIKSHNNKNTHYLFTYGGRFLKLYYKDLSTFDFDSEKMKGSFRKELIKYFFDDEITKKINKINAYELVKPYILKNKKAPRFEKYFKENVLDKTKKGDKIVLAYIAEDAPLLFRQDEIETYMNYKYFPHLSKVNIKDSLSEKEGLNAGYLSEMILTYTYGHLFDLLDKNYKLIKIEQYQRTTNDDYVKNWETDNFDKTTKWLAQNTITSCVFVTYQKMN